MSKRDHQTLSRLTFVIDSEELSSLGSFEELASNPKFKDYYIKSFEKTIEDISFVRDTGFKGQTNQIITDYLYDEIDDHISKVEEHGRKEVENEGTDLYDTLLSIIEITNDHWAGSEDKFLELLNLDLSFGDIVIEYAVTREPARRLTSLENKFLESLKERTVSASTVIKYAANCIGGRWPELEKLLLQRGNSIDLGDYAHQIQMKQWPEYEEFLLDQVINHNYVDSYHKLHGYWFRNRNFAETKVVKQALDHALKNMKMKDNPETKRNIIRFADAYARNTGIEDWPELTQARKKLDSI